MRQGGLAPIGDFLERRIGHVEIRLPGSVPLPSGLERDDPGCRGKARCGLVRRRWRFSRSISTIPVRRDLFDAHAARAAGRCRRAVLLDEPDPVVRAVGEKVTDGGVEALETAAGFEFGFGARAFRASACGAGGVVEIRAQAGDGQAHAKDRQQDASQRPTPALSMLRISLDWDMRPRQYNNASSSAMGRMRTMTVGSCPSWKRKT